MPYSIRNSAGAPTLAQAIIDTIPEPFVVLDDQFRVLEATRAFYETFKVDPAQTLGRPLYALGGGEWDIPALRLLLETILPEQATMDDFEVAHDFPNLGRKILVLGARKVLSSDSSNATILLSFIDVTARRANEREKEELLKQTQELLRQKQVLLDEMEHRVANSLQMIASILLLKARAVTSEETRVHLRDAHQRVMSIAAVQKHLHASSGVREIEVSSYLSTLCSSLAASMVADSQPIAIKVEADEGTVDSANAVSIGLIVTELLINAIKYAFPTDKADARVLVKYEIKGPDWKLTVADNGVGKRAGEARSADSGLGTAIVSALAQQLDAKIEIASDTTGTSVSITRATFTSRLAPTT
ncbi:signal transduction histidine kinase [Methylocella silvestris BL2]|uniref:histidine kinase n=1 Tax=Methylocella silvestris (strain DSM 15510 / CIP 108128 / LMG 27833 / NCIMB 13906 / BL2) TaxID=395965 RepID=B8ELN8_METSB|nr:PAS domain-containing sensor histidine kinase [Methylocella silvestris]ACK50032.1 signal transduction histidine kinase [Methylocella silvestris BL2]